MVIKNKDVILEQFNIIKDIVFNKQYPEQNTSLISDPLLL